MLPLELIRHAARLILSPTADEADRRRAVSGAYYALFSALTESGSDLFGVGANATLRTLIARSFEHRSMRKVCEAYKAPTTQNFAKVYSPMLPPSPDPRLFAVAEAFCRLQEARQAADYDMQAVISPSDARGNVRAAVKALGDWQAISATPEARVFLTALLLADRLTRRG